MTANAVGLPKTTKAAPGPNPLPRLSFLPRRLRSHLTELPRLLRDPLQYLLNAARDYGGVVALSPGRIYLVSHPEYIKYVLQDHHINYRKGPRYKFLKPTTGEGLLTSEGDFWLRQRRLVQPIFQRKHYHVFARTMTAAIQGMLDQWSLPETRGLVLDARKDLKDLALNILVQSIFGTGIGERGRDLHRALLVVADSIDPVGSIIPLPKSLPTPSRLRFRKAMRLIEEFVYGLIAERRRDQGQREDLLSMLVHVRDEETGESMSDKQVRDEALNMILGGHQTTSEALSWTLFLLSKHPAVARRLSAEVSSVLRGRAPEVEDLPSLSYNLMVIQEAMRLYPPAWVIARSPIRDDEIGNYHSQPTLRTATPRGAGRVGSTSASSPNDAERPAAAGAQGFPTGERLGAGRLTTRRQPARLAFRALGHRGEGVCASPIISDRLRFT
jgi:cytochrome P450